MFWDNVTQRNPGEGAGPAHLAAPPQIDPLQTPPPPITSPVPGNAERGAWHHQAATDDRLRICV
jgi:hypothetical protein